MIEQGAHLNVAGTISIKFTATLLVGPRTAEKTILPLASSATLTDAKQNGSQR